MSDVLLREQGEIENDINEFKSNEIQEFYLELSKIQKSDPKEKLIPKVSDENVGFFKRLFGNLPIKEEKSYENVEIEGYVSIAKFIEMLYGFLNYIYIESYNIVKKYEKISKSLKICFPCFSTSCVSRDYNQFIIAYFEYNSEEKFERKNYSLAYNALEVGFEEFPILKDGIQKEYEFVKEDIFRLIPYIKIYTKILKEVQYKSISLSPKANLKVHFDNENDVFRNEFPIVKLEISNIAMIEFSKKEKNREKYLSYAEDIELLEILKKSEKKLFYSCYVPEDLEIIKLLKKAEMGNKL